MREVALSSTRKAKIHKKNKERWGTYFDVQSQNFKGVEDVRELKKRVEERKIISTNTINTTSNQKAHFAEK